ncbi:unnamed protein product [Dibothriocephalus latus]|uniref:Dynein heavy chain ATP-binding dynein motor region domain-containing protein n=1 Tax=Dibothriocephalus latus TaxID=60516 RepID=A0A3P7NJK1_DIBLA|nr:unnamed protein product [Dibothriocephalus latus]
MILITSTNFVTRLELAVRFGKILIVQEVDQIEAILFPLLKADLSLQGPRATVKIGEKSVDYNEEFRLFMTTRQPLSSGGTVLPVCATSLVAVVNFQTTRAGLVGQLLEISLQHERAELEARRQELLKGEEDKKMELAQLEDNLLEVKSLCVSCCVVANSISALSVPKFVNIFGKGHLYGHLNRKREQQ